MTQVGIKTMHLLITTLAFVASGHVIAQTYYGKSEVIVRDTVKYVCINEGGAISLYNQDAVFVNVPQTLKNGEPMNTAISYEDMLSKPCYDLPEGLVNAMSKLLHAAFAPYERSSPGRGGKACRGIGFSGGFGRLFCWIPTFVGRAIQEIPICED